MANAKYVAIVVQKFSKVKLNMLHFRRRDRRLPDFLVQGRPDFGQFPIFEDAQDQYEYDEADHARAEALHEDAPDLGQREDVGKYLQREIRGVAHDD